MLNNVKKSDNELYKIIMEEYDRQRTGIEMIASESFVPIEILELQGSILTNKTMEGFPGNRYHGGFKFIDKMEILGIERAKCLFGAEHANIQPHSGSAANQGAYTAILKLNDTALGMRLDQGGHLTHGSKVNFSGNMYNFLSYGVNPETELLDYDELAKLADENKPKLIVAGASAYPRFIDFEKISNIAKNVGAYFMVDMAHVAGLVATGIHPNPVVYADFVTSTTTKTLCGARGGFILCRKEHATAIDKAVFPGSQGSCHLHIMAAKTFTFKRAMSNEFKQLMKQVVKNAKVLGGVLQEKGFRLVTGGTDTHMILVDVRPKKINGLQLETALDSVGITVNKNMIPMDPEKPKVTSGVRIGTTAMTIKGFKEQEMELLGNLINEVAENIYSPKKLDAMRLKVKELGEKFPLEYHKYLSENTLI